MKPKWKRLELSSKKGILISNLKPVYIRWSKSKWENTLELLSNTPNTRKSLPFWKREKRKGSRNRQWRTWAKSWIQSTISGTMPGMYSKGAASLFVITITKCKTLSQLNIWLQVNEVKISALFQCLILDWRPTLKNF